MDFQYSYSPTHFQVFSPWILIGIFYKSEYKNKLFKKDHLPHFPQMLFNFYSFLAILLSENCPFHSKFILNFPEFSTFSFVESLQQPFPQASIKIIIINFWIFSKRYQKMLFFEDIYGKSHFLIYGAYIKTNIITKLYICLYVIYDIDVIYENP